MYQVSPNNTIVTTPGNMILDAYGNRWGLTANGQVTVNGQIDITTKNVLTLAYENGKVWQMNADRLWYGKSKPGDQWGPTYGTTVSPLVCVASADNSMILGSIMAGYASYAGVGLTDANNDHWMITSTGQVAVNGVADATTANVIALAYEKGVMWQENAAGLWYGKSNARSAWSAPTRISPVQPGTINGYYLDGVIVNFINSASPYNYVASAVADGDKGVTFNFQGTNTTNWQLKVGEGTTFLNVASGTVIDNGLTTVQGGIGSAHENIAVATGATFMNNGRIDVNQSQYYCANSLAVTVNNSVPTNNSVFTNNGIIEANGSQQAINLTAIGGFVPSWNVSIANNGLIQVSGGASLYFTAPVGGTGTLEALSGAHMLVNGPVAAAETIHIDASTLEFGAPAMFHNPAMTFLGKITGESASSTIVVDGWHGSYGASESFKVLSTAGAGLGELLVYDQTHNLLADLDVVGHFQAVDFSLAHSGDPSGNTQTTIRFTDHVNTPWVAHS